MSVNRSVVRGLGGMLTMAAVVCVPAGPARAFCGFFVAGGDAKLFNNATQVVLMRKGNRTVLSMQNNYQGPPESFAMVVPVPVVLQKENVKTLPFDVFDRVDPLAAPRLVEYWEQDPCQPPMPPHARAGVGDGAWSGGRRRPRKRSKDLGVKIEAKFVAGEYEILILSARDSSGLETWLRQEKYKIPQGAAAALAPYVRDKSKFFVAKVDIKKVKRNAQGGVQLSPLRFHYDADELRLPVRLGLLNAGGKQDLIVYVIHPTARFEVANYANTFIPTNLDVADGVRNNFGAFYAELFDATVEKMGRKVVVTEYAWQTTGLRSVPDAAAVHRRSGDAGPRRPGRRRRRGARTGAVAARDHQARRRRARASARGAAAVLRPGAVVGADPPARALQQGDAVGGSHLPRGEAGDGRTRQLERHQRRRGRAGCADRRRRHQQLPGALHHPPLLERAGRLREPARTTTGAARPATRSATRSRPRPRDWRRRRAGRSCSRQRCARRCRCSASQARRRRDGRRPSDVHTSRRKRHERVGQSSSGNRSARGGGDRGGAGARPGVLRLLRRGQRREAVQQRDAGRADAQGHPHGAVDAEQLPGPARELRDGGPGAGRAARRRTSRRCPTTCSTASTRWRRRAWSSTGSRTRARRSAGTSRWRRRWVAAAMRKGKKPMESDEDLGVKIEAKFVVGEYEIVILSATDSTGLETWLRREKYRSRRARRARCAPYVRGGSKFFVAKVDIKKVKRDAQGVVQLSPLRFTTTPTSCACRSASGC